MLEGPSIAHSDTVLSLAKIGEVGMAYAESVVCTTTMQYNVLEYSGTANHVRDSPNVTVPVILVLLENRLLVATTPVLPRTTHLFA